jgi:DNA-binding NarL/FixJ family response regulator
MITVSIIEDDTDIRESLEVLINSTNGYRCVGHYGDCQSALAEIIGHSMQPNVILMDIGLPIISGIEGTRMFRRQCPNIIILVLSSHDNESLLFEALCAGAVGVLPKDSAVGYIMDIIGEVSQGEARMNTAIARLILEYIENMGDHALSTRAFGFSQQEMRIVQLLAEGNSSAMIADAMRIGEDGVRRCVYTIYRGLAGEVSN